MENVFTQRLICVAVIENPDDAVPLAQALMAGGLNTIEVTFRTEAAAEAIRRIRRDAPDMSVGAGTVLTPYQAALAAQAGAQFLVAPGLDEPVLATALARNLPYIPGVMTPTEIGRALNLKCKLLKFFPAEASGGVAMLKALTAPFAHTDAGADFVGGEEMVEKIQKENWTGFDALIATPDMMKVVGRVGKVLGPKGLMPNPKTGTVTMDVAAAVKEIKAGKVEFRADKTSLVHVPVGKLSFDPQKLIDNTTTVISSIVRAKPSAAKGKYIKSVTLSSTMGPGVPLDSAVADAAGKH